MHFQTSTILKLLPLLQLGRASSTLKTRQQVCCAPGYYVPNTGNFELQLPTGSDGIPDTVPGSNLTACGGYQSQWFSWNVDGDFITMVAPPSSSNCTKTTNSEHCRTEFRKTNPKSWSPSGINKLTVTMMAKTIDDGPHGTIIEQVFSAEYSKPVAELYYDASGDLYIGVEQSIDGGDSVFTKVGTISTLATFTWELSYSNNNLTFSLHDGDTQSFETSQLDNPDSYFKFGNYNQGTNKQSIIDVYSVNVVHN